MDGTAQDVAARKSRSRTGCFTCRRRKKRCDEAKPTCHTCMRLNLECEYPIPGLERKNKRRRFKEEQDSKANQSDAFKPDSDQLSDPSPPAWTLNSTPVGMIPLGAIETQGTKQSNSTENGMNFDILSPMFRFEEVFSGEHAFASMPSFSLPSVFLTEDNESTSVMLSVLSGRYPTLDPRSVELFEYFCDTQSQLMSVSPQNNFKQIFAHMALEHEPVLMGLLAWAAFHSAIKGPTRWSPQDSDEAGNNYLAKTISLVHNNQYDFPVQLAALLLVASSHICSGDVKNWREYLRLAATLIKEKVEVTKFVETEELYWLLQNFAYHDILASMSRKDPLLLSKDTYDHIFANSSTKMPDTLCACCQPIFSVLASINDLYQKISANILQPVDVAQQCEELLASIRAMAPDERMLTNLTFLAAEEQVQLFKAYQGLAELTLHNSVLKLNSSSVPMQVMNRKHLACIEGLLTKDAESALIFPLFIGGVTCSAPHLRRKISAWFADMYTRRHARNIKQATALMKEVWARDENGTKHVDWNDIAEIKGWHVSFA